MLTGRRPCQGPGDVGHVGDDRLDAVALALDLGGEARHLVPVELVLDGPVDVKRHLETLIFCFSSNTNRRSSLMCRQYPMVCFFG